ncbi:hypothetical protein NNJEOMEG_01289 [Fundidesulfovibrio magnetotacticus]|uniref:DUF3540 domain-containing protein n=1 Tax=Fundidesulfovibrio magnetotacticus TaxID=2730080 RepID=A0A6V8LUG8_9BACT|nr:DUF3540 domain-containing protein [Fundidesulfovibrio magnetotacticus]GFK93456.1 hypothetical protein NNJEOMEG_01289 [Fundidesulfovibrio magnetotacticus]
MNALAKMNPGGEEPVLSLATVTGALDGRLLVRRGGAVFPALRAAGCLLEPEPGDLVLAVNEPSGAAFVLSVLVRASQAPGRAGLEEGLTLHAGQGPLTLDAGRLGLRAGQLLEMSAPRATLEADKAEVRAGALSLAGESLTQAFARIRTAAGAMERVVGRLVERATRVLRRVDECEDVRAGRYRLDAEDSLRLDAGEMRLEARGNVDVDGRKIRLG